VQQHSKASASGDGDGAASGGGSGGQSNRWGLWALCWQLGRVVLNRLQLSITNVHLCFEVPPFISGIL